MTNEELEKFTNWLLDNHFRKNIRGFYYSGVNMHGDGQLFTFEELLKEYYLDSYAKVITNILKS